MNVIEHESMLQSLFEDMERPDDMLLLELSKHIGEWWILAVYLGIHDSTIKKIQREEKTTTKQCYEMLLKWREDNYKMPTGSVEYLKKQCKRAEIDAQTIEHIFGSKVKIMNRQYASNSIDDDQRHTSMLQLQHPIRMVGRNVPNPDDDAHIRKNPMNIDDSSEVWELETSGCCSQFLLCLCKRQFRMRRRMNKEQENYILCQELKSRNQRPSHSRNVEDEQDGNRSRNIETCTEDPHKKTIKTITRKRRIKELEACVKGLIEEKNILLNRLSEIGALKLIDNNPNITDLSDANRPEKLMEQLAEFYDNEWTDAYEDLTKTQGQTVVQSVNLLLQALKETYNICLSSTKERAITLRKAMLSIAGLPDEDSSEIELQEIEKNMWEYRAKKSQCNVSRAGKEVRERLRGQFKQLETESSNMFSLYIDGCIRICWYMCIKNPPMHLDFGENEQGTSATLDNVTSLIRKFNKTKFVPYTKEGPYIDYVVWPAVFIHDGGSIMRKGVAQGADLLLKINQLLPKI